MFCCCAFLLTFVWVFLDPAHEDYSNLQSAYEAMLDVSEYINEVKRDSEQLQIINDIQASITDLPIAHGVALKDYGRLRKDAELKVCICVMNFGFLKNTFRRNILMNSMALLWLYYFWLMGILYWVCIVMPNRDKVPAFVLTA